MFKFISIIVLLPLLLVIQFTTSASLQPSYEIFSYNDRHKHKEKIIEHLHDHGFIAFHGIPKYKEAYQEYLKIAQDFIKLPDSEKAKCSPTNNNELGWSYGIEKFNGQIDCHKGSYYAHVPEREYNNNIWPKSLPYFKYKYMNLASIMYEAGKDVMNLIGIESQNMTGLARMLYYAPVAYKEDNTNWCGLHFDHGVFTALTSATFEKDGALVKTPRKGGLYIRDTKIKIPQDVLIFQVGEAGELITNGKITATEHHVKKTYGGYGRYALALFFDLPMDTPIRSTVTKYNDRFEQGMTYGQWSRKSFKKYK